MNRQRRQETAVRQILRGAALTGALPDADDLDELRQRLRLPATSVALVERYATAIAEAGETATNVAALRKTADLLAVDVVKDLGPDDNTVDAASIAEAQSIRRQRSGGVKVDGDGGLVNVTVDRGDGPVSRSPERAPWAQ